MSKEQHGARRALHTEPTDSDAVRAYLQRLRTATPDKVLEKRIENLVKTLRTSS